MSLTTYLYYKAIAADRLYQEITSRATITVALDSMQYVPPADPAQKNLTLIFRAALSPTEKLTLDAIVQSHVAMPLDPEQDILKTTDKRQVVKANSRPILTTGFYTSTGDDTTAPGNVGDGANVIKMHHQVGGDTSVDCEQDFNVEGNRSWLYEGYLFYKDCLFDELTFTIRPKVTPITTGTGLNYARSGPMIVPCAPGTGNTNIDIATVKPVSVVPKTDTGICPAAYWNMTYTNGVYSNITPALDGKGKYNLFWMDYPLKRYINRFCILGSGMMKFETTDPSEMGTNMRAVYTFKTNIEEGVPDHEWWATISTSMYRQKS